MSIYGLLDPMLEYRTQLDFKRKGEHRPKVKIPNRANLSQQINTEIPYASRDHVIVPDTVKITFNIDIESTGKTRSVVKNVCRELAKTERNMIQSTTQVFMTLTRIFA